MPTSLRITASNVDGFLPLDLPWRVPLADWPEEMSAQLPRGISRHTVRFIYVDNTLVAVKEIGAHRAHHEYQMLRELQRLGAPCVTPLAVVDGRTDSEGNDLAAVLVTEHLTYSLPFRALFAQRESLPDFTRLISALSVLLVRLHLLGFFWGDVSLSNTLFRRDAGEFTAYLVDAETGELHDSLTKGKRSYEIDVARTNIIGELMDLQAAGYIDEDFDTIAIGDLLESRYNDLWQALTSETIIDNGQQWRITERIQRLNDLGFEVGEMEISADADGQHMRIQPKIVDAGHYSRKIRRLTGMQVHENQARRLMNDINSYRTTTHQMNVPLSMVAHDWMSNIFEPTVRAVPRELVGKLEPAELFHQYLDHRWYVSEKAGYDVPWAQVVTSFINTVLLHQRDERTVFVTPTAASAYESFSPGVSPSPED